jgi:type I protein arginine methyltransferase
MTLDSDCVSAQVEMAAKREGAATGFGLWFDSELADGIWMSSAPGQPDTVYWNMFAPWSERVELQQSDSLTASFSYSGIKDVDIWRWDTRIRAAGSGQVKAEFHQSNFESMFVSAERLRRRRPEHCPRLNCEGSFGTAMMM